MKQAREPPIMGGFETISQNGLTKIKQHYLLKTNFQNEKKGQACLQCPSFN